MIGAINAMTENANTQEKGYILQNFISNLSRELLPNIIEINGRGKRRSVRIKFNEITLSNILFNHRIKDIVKSENNIIENIKLINSEILAKYFLLDDPSLDRLLSSYSYQPKDLEKIFVIIDEKLVVKPEFITESLKNNNIDLTLYLLSTYSNSDSYKYISYKELAISEENLEYIVSLYGSFSEFDNDISLKGALIDAIENDKEFLAIDINNLKKLKKVLINLNDRLLVSNSQELKNFSAEILFQILKGDSPDDYQSYLDKIEDVFARNNLPVVGKKFLIFAIVHKDLKNYDFKSYKMSPTLRAASSNDERLNIIFNDLLRCTLGSNNTSIRRYLENIAIGNDLYLKIISKEITIDNIGDDDKKTLEIFVSHLATLYNNTIKGKENPYNLCHDLKTDLYNLIPLFNITNRYTLPDRIVRMFAYRAGFTSFNQIMDYMDNVVKRKNQESIDMCVKPFSLEKGDLIKGIGNINYLYDILQNGSVAKDFLGAHMASDSTPLDTDISFVHANRKKISDVIETTYSSAYGPVYFVIKKDKYPITRTGVNSKESITNGPECFVTDDSSVGGIRTGFPSSDIDYIIIDNSEENITEKVSFIVALNGIYIPVVDKKTEKLLFSYNDFLNIRKSMAGLSRYGINDFELSPNIKAPIDFDNHNIIEDSKLKREKIDLTIKKILKEKFDLKFNNFLNTDITKGSVDFIDTGSTGRGTNIDKKSDFDFIMRIDEGIDSNDVSRAIVEGLGLDYDQAQSISMVINNGNLRLKNIRLNGIDEPIDIDITFVSKSDMIEYTTDMALKERLECIKKNNSEKYYDVLDNIMYAKKFLKDIKAYKPNHSRDQAQGGLGGVGIENWILQHGGSFYDACLSFYECATENGICISFKNFKKKYKIYDFGVNFYTGKYDEFVSSNMSEEGYKKMYKAIKEYLKKFTNNYHYDGTKHDISYSYENTIERKR